MSTALNNFLLKYRFEFGMVLRSCNSSIQEAQPRGWPQVQAQQAL